MHEPTHYSLAAASYARAIFELASEQGQPVEIIGQELNDIRGMIKGDEAFRLYLSDPAISSTERQGVLKRSFDNQINPVLFKTILVMNDKSRLSLLSEISDAYDALLDEKLGKIEVDLYVAQKLLPEQLEQAKQQISAALKRDAVVHTYVDETLIGGAMLRIGDRLIDASVKQQLRAIKEKLLASRPN